MSSVPHSPSSVPPSSPTPTPTSSEPESSPAPSTTRTPSSSVQLPPTTSSHSTPHSTASLSTHSQSPSTITTPQSSSATPVPSPSGSSPAASPTSSIQSSSPPPSLSSPTSSISIPTLVTFTSTSTVFLPTTQSPSLSVSGTGSYTFTSVFASTDASGQRHTITQVIARPTNTSSKPNGFLANTGAVAGVSVVVGIVGAAIIAFLILWFLRRRRNQQHDRDLEFATVTRNDRYGATDQTAYDLDSNDGHGIGGMSNLSHGTHGTYEQPPMATLSSLQSPQRYPPPRSAGGNILADEFPEEEEYNPYGNDNGTSGVAGFGAGARHYNSAVPKHPYAANSQFASVAPQYAMYGEQTTSRAPPDTAASGEQYVHGQEAYGVPSASYLVKDPFADRHNEKQNSSRRSASGKSRPESAPSVYADDDNDDEDLYGGYYVADDDKSEVTGLENDPRLDEDAVAQIRARRAAFAQGGSDSHVSGASLQDNQDYSRKILK